jgi:hypothetical protein
MGRAAGSSDPRRRRSAVRDEGVFTASIWRSEGGELVGRVQIATGHDEPTVTLTGTVVEMREMFERWIVTLEGRSTQDDGRTSS